MAVDLSLGSIAAANEKRTSRHADKMPIDIPEGQPLWQLEFAEVTGHNLEARGRKVVNELLQAGWRLLHIYTLRYEENGVWRERPMAILGRLKQDSQATVAVPKLVETAQDRKGSAPRVVSLDAAGLRLFTKPAATPFRE